MLIRVSVLVSKWIVFTCAKISMSEKDFQTSTKSKRSVNRLKLRSFDELLEDARKLIRESEFLESLCKSLEGQHVDRVRCLALGSFHQDSPARFQLALLLELLSSLNVTRCSLYDPAFDEEDLAYIKGQDYWSVDAESPFAGDKPDSILFFLPHAPLDLTEKIISKESPRIWLANHLVQHTDRYTKTQLHDKYPLISKLVNYIDLKTLSKTKTGNEIDEEGFQQFTSSRKRNAKARKNKFKQPSIDYKSVDSYFTDCSIINDFRNGSLLTNKPWLNSFSDLTLHMIESN